MAGLADGESLNQDAFSTLLSQTTESAAESTPAAMEQVTEAPAS
ncbi:hypothetical protein [Aggregatilinea lenta]|nr:hypothetical protein [Aggregatilinea lenta]